MQYFVINYAAVKKNGALYCVMLWEIIQRARKKTNKNTV